MIKSVLFIFLYATAGIGSWSAYSFISEQDSSINSLTKLAAQIQPELADKKSTDTSDIVYRLKDYTGNGNHEDSPYSELSFDNYEDELKFLKNLKKEREQTTSHISEETDTVLASVSTVAQIKKLFNDAINIRHLLEIQKHNTDDGAK